MSVREILKDLVKDFVSEKYVFNLSEPTCMRFDEAISKLKAEVEGLKKGRKIYFGEDQSSDKVKGYNQAISDVIKLLET